MFNNLFVSFLKPEWIWISAWKSYPDKIAGWNVLLQIFHYTGSFFYSGAELCQIFLVKVIIRV